jgi:hypothetical protein
MSSPKSRAASITSSGWSSRICSGNRAGGGVAQVSNQKAMTGGASATFGALRQGSLENRALNRVADPCRATILSRRAAVLWIGSLSLIGWAAILALAVVIL